MNKDIHLNSIIVVCPMALTDEQMDRLHRVSSRLEFHVLPDVKREELSQSVHDSAEVVFGNGAFLYNAQQMPSLNWIQVTSAGVDRLQGQPIWKSDVAITTASGIHGVPIAERTMAMILAFRAKLPELWHYKQQKQWPAAPKSMFANPGVRGSTLGIIGYGAIGGEIARQADALGMRVLGLNTDGTRRVLESYVEPGTGDPEMRIPEQMYARADLAAMLAECDHVVALAPLTPATRHMIDAQAFASMKQTAYFYNFGRGPIVDETALISALEQGDIAGAGLDVFEQEPLPADSPLWGMPNVIISPHVGGSRSDYTDRAIDVFAYNLQRYLDNEPLVNAVDRKRGY